MVYFLIYFLIKKRNGKNIKRPAGGGGRIGMLGRYEGGGIGIGALFTFIRRVSGIG